MHLRRNRTSGPRTLIDGLADPRQRREIAERTSGLAERASDTAARVAAEVAKKSADATSRVGQSMSEIAHAVADDRHEVPVKRQVRKPRKHRLRRSVLLVGLGAVVAYFFDPQRGTARRAAVLRRTSDSAQVLGDGLGQAARVAHQAADATAAHSASGAYAGDPFLSER